MIVGHVVYTGGWIDPAKDELKGLSQTWRLVGRREDGRKWKQSADMRQGRATHGCVADTYKVFQKPPRLVSFVTFAQIPFHIGAGEGLRVPASWLPLCKDEFTQSLPRRSQDLH